MKKLFLTLLSVFLIFSLYACGGEQEEIKYIDIEATNVDMSVYDGMNSINHNFKLITPTELLRVYKEGGSGIFYIGYSGCSNCQHAVANIQKAAEENGVTVYYMDCYNAADLLSDHVDDFIATFSDVLEERDGEKTILTPHLMTFVNGKVADSIIGLPDGDSDAIVKVYSDAMAKFASQE